jgi:NADPH:quinone reductase-like Zn-dependent oxidoreductase
MFALTYAEYGGPSVLEVTKVPDPHAGPGQVRIAVRAAAVNPFDWKIRCGMLKDMIPMTFPVIPGLEAAGVVDQVGEGVADVSLGAEVFGLGSRTSAQFALLDHWAVKPTALSWAQAAGVSNAAEAGLRALELLGPAPGDTLLIDGAAGGVGSAAAQFAVADSVTVVGTASESNHEYLRTLGVVPTTYGPGLAERVLAVAPTGVDVALDTAGRGSLTELIEIVGSPERVVTIADPSAPEHGVRLSSASSAFHALPKAAHLFERGRFAVAVDSQFELSDAAKAHERSEGGHVTGKIILTVPEA